MVIVAKEFRIGTIETLKEVQKVFLFMCAAAGKNKDYIEVTGRRNFPPKKIAWCNERRILDLMARNLNSSPGSSTGQYCNSGHVM